MAFGASPPLMRPVGASTVSSTGAPSRLPGPPLRHRPREPSGLPPPDPPRAPPRPGADRAAALRRPGRRGLRERGLRHEAAYLEHLRNADGRDVERLEDPFAVDAGAKVSDAMRRGVSAIAQAPLAQGRWRGIADVLLRVEEPSDLGAWSYEPSTRSSPSRRRAAPSSSSASTRSSWGAPGPLPDAMYVVKPARLRRARALPHADYLAYYRRVRDGLAAALDAAPGAPGGSTAATPSPSRSATSAAGGRAATGSAATTTTSPSWPA